MNKLETYIFFLTLRMTGFEDTNLYDPKGDTGESVCKEFGRLIYKNGSIANFYNSSYTPEKAVHHFPSWCIAYIDEGKMTLSVFRRKLSEDAKAIEQVEEIHHFNCVTELLTLTEQLQAEANQSALNAIGSIDVSLLDIDV